MEKHSLKVKGFMIDTDFGNHAENGYVIADHVFGESAEANARLIAAAPELYEALEIAAGLIGAPWDGFAGLEDDDEIEHEVVVRIGDVKRFAAALAKARGEA
jgi:hypothetical protein